jgi:hypothetical protein
MNNFQLLSQPWWVNLLIIVPFLILLFCWKNKLEITKKQLRVFAIFGVAFGFVEASVVVYLRAAIGYLPNYTGTLSDIVSGMANSYQNIQVIKNVPIGLMTVEFFREIATIVMFWTIAIVTVKKNKEQCAVFLWAFAFWDIFYYVGLWATIRWPIELTTNDVLFLIPTAWIGQVWFPLLVSILTIFAIIICRKNPVKE